MSASACPDLAFPKAGRIKLTGKAYAAFRHSIMERDGWQCLLCGSTRNLCLEHVRNRSDLRLDTVANCFTACVSCNQAVKDKHLDYVWEPNTRKVTVVRLVAYTQFKTLAGRQQPSARLYGPEATLGRDHAR